MSLFVRVFIFLFLLLLGPLSAFGLQLQDSKTDFSVSLDFPKNSVCIAYPKELGNPENCFLNLSDPDKELGFGNSLVGVGSVGPVLFKIMSMRHIGTTAISKKEGLEFFKELFSELKIPSEKINFDAVMLNDQPFYKSYWANDRGK